MRRHRTHRPWDHPRGTGGLFRRIYLHGLLLLFVVALAVGLVAALLGPALPGRNADRVAAYVGQRVSELRGDSDRLTLELRRVREAFGIAMTVYAGGRVVATSAEPPLPPLSARDEARLAGGPVHLHRGPFAFAVTLAGSPPGFVVLAGTMHAAWLSRAAALLGAILLALALASIPLARAISAPVERLTRAARALGEGDLSARARLRAGGEIGELSRAFDEMADRLERLLRSEKELIANVSHELRTPLARIRVALELAAEGDLEKVRRYLAEIGTDLGELERLVDDVLATARLDLAAGRAGGVGLPLHRERVEMGSLLQGAADRFRAAHPGHVLELEVADALPSVEGDPALLRRLVENLLDNAGKYSDAGAPVRLAARAGPGGVEIEVRDRGIGIAPEDLPRLFTPFFRTDASRARGTGGVGLGLALAKRIAEGHGGRITVESAPGQGTSVGVLLPARAA